MLCLAVGKCGIPGTAPGEVPIYHVCLTVGKCGWIRPGWCAKRSRHRTLTTNVYLAMQHKDMKEDKDLSSVFVPTLFLSLCRIYLHYMSWFDHLGFTPGRQGHLLVPMEKDKGLKHWNPTIKQIYVCMCAPRHGVRKCVRVHVRTQSRLTLDSHFVFLMFFPGTPPGEVPIYHAVPRSGKMWMD